MVFGEVSILLGIKLEVILTVEYQKNIIANAEKKFRIVALEKDVKDVVNVLENLTKVKIIILGKAV
jgi:hypothetical protein